MVRQVCHFFRARLTPLLFASPPTHPPAPLQYEGQQPKRHHHHHHHHPHGDGDHQSAGSNLAKLPIIRSLAEIGRNHSTSKSKRGMIHPSTHPPSPTSPCDSPSPPPPPPSHTRPIIGDLGDAFSWLNLSLRPRLRPIPDLLSHMAGVCLGVCGRDAWMPSIGRVDRHLM